MFCHEKVWRCSCQASKLTHHWFWDLHIVWWHKAGFMCCKHHFRLDIIYPLHWTCCCFQGNCTFHFTCCSEAWVSELDCRTGCRTCWKEFAAYALPCTQMLIWSCAHIHYIKRRTVSFHLHIFFIFSHSQILDSRFRNNPQHKSFSKFRPNADVKYCHSYHSPSTTTVRGCRYMRT